MTMLVRVGLESISTEIVTAHTTRLLFRAYEHAQNKKLSIGQRDVAGLLRWRGRPGGRAQGD